MKTHIGRILIVAFAALFLLAPLGHAGDTKVVGAWDMVASTPQGDMASLLTVTQAGAELDVELSIEGVARRVTDAKMEGDVFKMTVHVDGVPYDVEANVDGDTLEGSWSGTDASGTLKATRKP